MKRLLVCSLGAAIALVSTACGTATPDETASAVEDSSPTTYRFESVRRSAGEPQPGAEESRLTVTVDKGQERREFFDHRTGCRTIMIGPVMYLETPKEDGASGTEWLRLADVAASATARDEEGRVVSLGTLDTTLETIRAAGGEPTRVGEEAVRGEPTTRYHARLDLRQAVRLEREASGRESSPIETYLEPDEVDGVLDVDVWIGDEGLVRRVVEHVVYEFDKTVSLPGSVTTTEFFDFGVPVDIEPPPAEAVVEASGWTAYPEPSASDDADAESRWQPPSCRG